MACCFNSLITRHISRFLARCILLEGASAVPRISSTSVVPNGRSYPILWRINICKKKKGRKSIVMVNRTSVFSLILWSTTRVKTWSNRQSARVIIVHILEFFLKKMHPYPCHRIILECSQKNVQIWRWTSISWPRSQEMDHSPEVTSGEHLHFVEHKHKRTQCFNIFNILFYFFFRSTKNIVKIEYLVSSTTDFWLNLNKVCINN